MDVEKVTVCVHFHKRLLEGLAAGPAGARTGIRGENIELNSSVWDIQAYYAQAAVNATVFFHDVIVVEVMAQQHMLDQRS